MDESHRNRGDHSMLLLDWPWIDSGWAQCYRNQWRIYEVESLAHDMADLYYRRICSHFSGICHSHIDTDLQCIIRIKENGAVHNR